MIIEDDFECPCCEGWSTIKVRSLGKNEIIQRGCDADCTLTDEQLLAAHEEYMISRSERSYERSLSGDSGPLPLDEQLRQTRKEKRLL